MFDKETKSLWNTFEGVPVVGPLVGSGVRLTHRSVVTTTWDEWRRTHPQTTVLSLSTGHTRDYSEGAAYRQYFSSDRLMFQVPGIDKRLKNKAEVVVMLLEDDSGARQPLAIAAKFLADNKVFHTDHAGKALVVVTTAEGANRVYASEGLQFARSLGNDRGHRHDRGDLGRLRGRAGCGERPSEASSACCRAAGFLVRMVLAVSADRADQVDGTKLAIPGDETRMTRFSLRWCAAYHARVRSA